MCLRAGAYFYRINILTRRRSGERQEGVGVGGGEAGSLSPVSYGDVIGLFFNGSLLNAAELIYYPMVVVFPYPRRRCIRQERRFPRRGSCWLQAACGGPLHLSRVTAFQITAAGKKPAGEDPEESIPILVNYSPVKSNLNRYETNRDPTF